MNPQALIVFTPFLAVLFIVYALIQVLRKKQQGFIAALLAFIALAAPLAALIISQDAAAQTRLTNYLMLNAMIVFIGSIIVLLLERRYSTKGSSRSYGMLGIGLGVLIAVEVLAYPALASTLNTTNAATLPSATGSDPTLQNVSQTTSITAGTSAFAEALTVQTGLTTDEITAQLQSGSKIADLVTKNNGDLNAVITAAASTLDNLAAQGGRSAQMISRLGDDTTAIATQYVQGELANARAQQLLTTVLLSGEAPSLPQRGQNSSAGNIAPQDSANQNTNGSNVNTQNVAQVPTVQPTEASVTPTETMIRPTVISFPSVTPTPIAPEATEAPEQASVEAAATCTITAAYNLNLRNQPNTTESTVYLSIPFGTSVDADGRTTDDWYSVTYNGQAGWVSGQYVTTDGTCDKIATVNAS